MYHSLQYLWNKQTLPRLFQLIFFFFNVIQLATLLDTA